MLIKILHVKELFFHIFEKNNDYLEINLMSSIITIGDKLAKYIITQKENPLVVAFILTKLHRLRYKETQEPISIETKLKIIKSTKDKIIKSKLPDEAQLINLIGRVKNQIK